LQGEAFDVMKINIEAIKQEIDQESIYMYLANMVLRHDITHDAIFVVQ